MKLWKWFFDGASAGEHDSADLNDASAGKTTPDSDPIDEGIPGIDGEDHSAFDEKSPLLFAGRDDDDEGEEEEEETPPVDGSQAAGAEPPVDDPATPAEEPKPYRTLKYHGQEIPIETEDDLIRLASQGLDYTRKTQQLAPYRALIDRINSDPSLMEKVVTLVQTGTLPAQQTVTPAPRGPEPEEPDDDETWDEFIERRNRWREAQNKALAQNEEEIFMQRFNAALEARQRQEESAHMAALTMRDPYCRDVLSAFQEQLPPALLETMNNDPRTFRLVYDQMRVMLGQGPYFASLGRTPQTPVPHAQTTSVAPTPTPAPAQQQPQAQKPTQTVTLKSGSTKAPFVEPSRGQKTPGAVKKTLPGLPDDVWDLPDKDFSALVDKALRLR
jgi:hypothetical protein